jgi:hypothetical protein
MKTHYQNQDLFLYTFAEFEALITRNLLTFKNRKESDNIPEKMQEFAYEEKKVGYLNKFTRNNLESSNCPYKKFTNWTRNFIAKPNILLGRSGAVCPYVSLSIKKQLFFCTIYSGSFSQDIVEEKLLQYADWFLELEEGKTKEASLKTFAILLNYPDIPDRDVSQFMTTMHTRLKPKFLSKRLMLGEFFPGHSKGSIWNKNFHPLSSPLPVFVIRYMIDVDYNFLEKNPLYLSSYLKFFQDKIPKK